MGSDTTGSGESAPITPWRAAVWSVSARGVQAAASLISVILVGLTLSPEEQGYFYSFASLTAFLPLAEFGVSYAVMQSCSHYANDIEWTADGAVGAPASLARIDGLLKVAYLWNRTATALASLALIVVGFFILDRSQALTLWWDWIALLICAGAWQLLAPRLAVLEGCGRVEQVWRFRVGQEAFAATLLALSLVAGLGLLSLAVSFAARVAAGILWLSKPAQRLHQRMGMSLQLEKEFWRQEVWPFQWRIGISVLCGFLIYYLFTPVILTYQGPIAAGRFGMSMAIALGLQGATTAWVASQAPHYGTLIAARHYVALDRDFLRTFTRSTLTAIVGAVCILLTAHALSNAGVPFARRLLDAAPLALLLAAAVVNHMVIALAVYLRAHRRDPLLIPSLIGAGAMSTGILWAAQAGGALTIALLYFTLTLLGLGMATTVFITYRRRWHRG